MHPHRLKATPFFSSPSFRLRKLFITALLSSALCFFLISISSFLALFRSSSLWPCDKSKTILSSCKKNSTFQKSANCWLQAAKDCYSNLHTDLLNHWPHWCTCGSPAKHVHCGRNAANCLLSAQAVLKLLPSNP